MVNSLPQSIRSFSILTYNTHLFKGSNPAFAKPSLVAYDDERISELVKRIFTLSPDVVCLQEVWAVKLQEHLLDQLRKFYPFTYSPPDQGQHKTPIPELLRRVPIPIPWIPVPLIIQGIDATRDFITASSGLIVASKYPMSDIDFTMYEGMEGDERWAKKGIINFKVTLPVSNTETICIRIGTTHCSTTTKIALEHIENIAAPKSLDGSDVDRILLGDFNLNSSKLDDQYNKLNKIMNSHGAYDLVERIRPNLEDNFTVWESENHLTWVLDDKEGKENAPTSGKDRPDHIYFAPCTKKTGNKYYLVPREIEVFHDWIIPMHIQTRWENFDTLEVSDHCPIYARFDVSAPTIISWLSVLLLEDTVTTKPTNLPSLPVLLL
jgi:endonuclease/exonuclease/phosphatase family metal-dependent hydrolase